MRAGARRTGAGTPLRRMTEDAEHSAGPSLRARYPSSAAHRCPDRRAHPGGTADLGLAQWVARNIGECLRQDALADTTAGNDDLGEGALDFRGHCDGAVGHLEGDTFQQDSSRPRCAPPASDSPARTAASARQS